MSDNSTMIYPRPPQGEMSERKLGVCPILSIHPSRETAVVDDYTPCLGDGCAWWDRGGRRCHIATLGSTLRDLTFFKGR